jgi:hypothetical protein
MSLIFITAAREFSVFPVAVITRLRLAQSTKILPDALARRGIVDQRVVVTPDG